MTRPAAAPTGGPHVDNLGHELFHPRQILPRTLFFKLIELTHFSNITLNHMPYLSNALTMQSRTS